MNRHIKLANALAIVGILFLLWAFLGNYLALPGYLRFLARGRTSVAGSSSDLAVVIGMIKTITWIFSFHAGVLFMLLSGLFRNPASNRTRWSVIIGGLIWFGVAGIPYIPGPYRFVYIVGGGLVLLFIVLTFHFWSRERGMEKLPPTPAADLKAIGYAFFALASWDVCGLGTMGRMLHLDQAVGSGTGPLLITQSAKIMLEFTLAWLFTVLGHYSAAKR